MLTFLYITNLIIVRKYDDDHDQYCLPICTVCEEQSEHHGNCRDHNSANKKEGAAKKCIRNQNIVLSTHKKRTHVCSLLIRSLSRLPSSINSLNGSFVLTKIVFCGTCVCLLWYTCTCIWFYNTKKLNVLFFATNDIKLSLYARRGPCTSVVCLWDARTHV